jgi:hypothetical protein
VVLLAGALEHTLVVVPARVHQQLVLVLVAAQGRQSSAPASETFGKR